MKTSPETSAVEEVVRSVRSDELPQLAAFIEHHESLTGGDQKFSIDLILDANVVIRELRWLASKRKDPTARSALMELMDCRTVQAYAPFFLHKEIRKHLPAIASELGVEYRKLDGLWKKYRKSIRFIAVGGPDPKTKNGDPKDVPYLRLQKRLDCAIVSDDRHIRQMGGKSVKLQLFAPLRAYARNVAIEYQLKATGITAILLVNGLLSGLGSLLQKSTKLPKPVMLGALSAFLIVILNPSLRRKFGSFLAQSLEAGKFLTGETISALTPFLEKHSEVKVSATHFLAQANKLRTQPET